MQGVGVRNVVVRLVFAALWSAIVLAASTAALSSAARAQDAVTAGPIQLGSTSNDNPQPWTVNCTSQAQTGELVCTMTQVLIAADTQQRLVGASVFRPQPSAAAVMRISLPHGILLQQGVDIWIDDAQPAKAPIVIADENGSYADVELGSDMLTRLQGGSFLRLGVSAGNGERVEFSLSLKGFTAAFAKL